MKTDYFPSELPNFRPAHAHFPSPLVLSLSLARDRVHAHPAVFCFCVHTFTYPLQSAVSLHIRSEEKAVIYLHLLLHLAQTEGERE